MNCRPDIAVVTNVSPNHLDIHPSYEDYQTAKSRFSFHRAVPASRCSMPTTLSHAPLRKIAPAKSGFSAVRPPRKTACSCAKASFTGLTTGEKTKLMDAESILLPGLHNVENYMAAFAATDGIVSDDTCRAVAESFRGVAHRRNDPDAAWRYLLQRFHCIQPHAHDRGTSRAAAEAHPYCGRVR